MDVMHCAFGEALPTDFPNLLPKLYQATDELMSCHHAIVQKGRTRAVVGMYPVSWQIGCTTLRMAGIGGVSTHPRCRGEGLMQRLMTHC